MSEWVPGSMSVVHLLLMRSRNCSGARRIVFLIKYSIKRGRTVCVYLLWLHDVMRLNLQLNSRHAALFHSCPSIGFTCFLRWSNNSLGSPCRRLSHLDGSRLCNRGGGRWGGRAWSNVSSRCFSAAVHWSTFGLNLTCGAAARKLLFGSGIIYFFYWSWADTLTWLLCLYLLPTRVLSLFLLLYITCAAPGALAERASSAESCEITTMKLKYSHPVDQSRRRSEPHLFI